MSYEGPAGVRVSLSSGEEFYVADELIRVAGALRARGGEAFVFVGSRLVNPAQVVQLEHVPAISTVHVLERLED